MNPEQFAKNLAHKQTQLKAYVNAQFPRRAGEISLRFIDGNFRAQGWQGNGFHRWKKNARNGTILIKSGRLRRSTSFQTMPGVVRVANNAPYAAAHNSGFHGTVRVKSHTRRLMAKKSIETGRILKSGKKQIKTVHVLKSMTKVKVHIRRMNIPRRQFMPESMNDSPVLYNALRREIERKLKDLF